MKFANTVFKDGWLLLLKTKWIVLGVFFLSQVSVLLSSEEGDLLSLLLQFAASIVAMVSVKYFFYAQLISVLKTDQKSVKLDGEFNGFFWNTLLIGLISTPAYVVMIGGARLSGLDQVIVGRELYLFFALCANLVIWPIMIVISTALAARLLVTQKSILCAFRRIPGQIMYVVARFVPISILATVLKILVQRLFEVISHDGAIWATFGQVLVVSAMGYYVMSIAVVIIGRVFVRSEGLDAKRSGPITMPYVSVA